MAFPASVALPSFFDWRARTARGRRAPVGAQATGRLPGDAWALARPGGLRAGDRDRGRSSGCEGPRRAWRSEPSPFHRGRRPDEELDCGRDSDRPPCPSRSSTAVTSSPLSRT